MWAKAGLSGGEMKIRLKGASRDAQEDEGIREMEAAYPEWAASAAVRADAPDGDAALLCKA